MLVAISLTQLECEILNSLTSTRPFDALFVCFAGIFYAMIVFGAGAYFAASQIKQGKNTIGLVLFFMAIAASCLILLGCFVVAELLA